MKSAADQQGFYTFSNNFPHVTVMHDKVEATGCKMFQECLADKQNLLIASSIMP